LQRRHSRFPKLVLNQALSAVFAAALLLAWKLRKLLRLGGLVRGKARAGGQSGYNNETVETGEDF
jgi:hypothetical protein